MIGGTTSRTVQGIRPGAHPWPPKRQLKGELLGQPLTRREQEVLALIRDGLFNSEIAESLVVSVKTVEAHILHLYQKTGTTRRVPLALWRNNHERFLDEEAGL